MNRYVLRPRPPRRALVLGVAATVLGLAAGILGIVLDWALVVVILGLVVLAAGIAVLALLAYSLAHHSLHVDLDEVGFRVHGPGLDKRGSWAHVTRVALTPDGSRLVIASGAIKRTYIICSNGGDDPVMKAVVADIASRVAAISA
ncbi:hypothetical protein SAMN05443377_1177 [Propionibacterium cyclohexanicum]|uniref:PH domain-containing protein n=1 Tax=Propionibacterium cyclohexanicum TaxID=64702 RepID=A0A1H9SY70_9ACTN|nr:hypothetical protein [Propionibacterium cyclohexanicum]SER89818.1 hypothetical protein SAMN05443377_1177 [Propionibacterium cyclohexanicum]